MHAFRSVVIVLTALMGSAAYPCSISPSADAADQPMRALERAELVMTATVAHVEKAGPYVERVELQVQRAFKGASENSPLILLHFIGGTCAVPLQAGQQYLLFARLFSESDYPGQYEIIAVRGEPATRAIAILERGG